MYNFTDIRNCGVCAIDLLNLEAVLMVTLCTDDFSSGVQPASSQTDSNSTDTCAEGDITNMEVSSLQGDLSCLVVGGGTPPTTPPPPPPPPTLKCYALVIKTYILNREGFVICQ